MKRVKPRVAVLIPAYCSQDTLQQTVDSLPDQPWLQVVVYDDASPTPLRVENRFRHAQLCLLRGKENLGVAGALDMASKAMDDSVRYLMELDSDDLLLPGALETMYRLLDTDPNLDLAWGDLQVQGRYSYLRSYPRAFDPWLVGVKNCLPVSSLMRRSTWQRSGASWGKGREHHQDWYMWLRFARLGAKGQNIGCASMIYNRRPGGLHLANLKSSADRRAATLEMSEGLDLETLSRQSSTPRILRLLLGGMDALGWHSFRAETLRSALIGLIAARSLATFWGRLRELRYA